MLLLMQAYHGYSTFQQYLFRDLGQKEDGIELVTVVYPKFKNGEASVRIVRVEQNFGM